MSIGCTICKRSRVPPSIRGHCRALTSFRRCCHSGDPAPVDGRVQPPPVVLTQVPPTGPEPARRARRSAPGAPGKASAADADRGAAAELQRYRKAWVAARHNVAEAARALGLSRAQLAYRLKRGGLL